MIADEKNSWLNMGELCCSQGEFHKMRACGQEIVDIDENDADGWAMMAEASLCLAASGETEEAEAAREYVEKARMADAKNIRSLLVQAELYWSDFQLDKAMPAFKKLLRYLPDVENGKYGSEYNGIMERGLCFYADACILAGEPEEAYKAAFSASQLTDNSQKKGILYSKGLFLTNYRSMNIEKQLKLHQNYNKLIEAKMQFPHNLEKRRMKHSLRIGYISPDFRNHAAAYFFVPFLKYANRTDFKTYVYHTGKSDNITNKFKKLAAVWCSMEGQTPQQIARKIFDDKIDILVDLSGHSQDSCLPVMAFKPAPVQISGIGYVNTTGVEAVDYFLTDDVCLPSTDKGSCFSELTLRLPHCHLCYAPELMRDTKIHVQDAPFLRNGYITFGCFSNFLKVTEDVLLCWRNILENVPNSKLVIKSKICSIPSGREIVLERCRRVAIDIKRIELRPYSPDYLQQYNDIDIALDTWPYTGGVTACDAIYMGVPLIARIGRTHRSRFSASILAAAGLKDFVAINDMDYVARAVKLAKNKDLLNMLHHDLPNSVRQSRLMNGREYMAELEEAYHGIWSKYCRSDESDHDGNS